MPIKNERKILNKGSEKLQTFYRYAFGLLSPVLLSLAMVYAALAFYDYLQRHEQSNNLEMIKERAELTLASVHSTLTFASQFTHYGTIMAGEIESCGPASFSADLLQNKIYKHFPEGFIDKQCKTWAFSLRNGRPAALFGQLFENSNRRAFEMLTVKLLEFANNPDLTLSQINNSEKFVKSVLGEHAAPMQLGRNREGELTPVIFQGGNYFIYWRQYRHDDKPFAALVSLIPAERAADIRFALSHIADKTFKDSKRRFAVAFMPVKELADKLPVIVPAQLANATEYRDSLTGLLAKMQKQAQASQANGSLKQLNEIDEHLFVHDMAALDVPYDIIVFSRKPSTLRPREAGILTGMSCTLAIWLMIFLYFYHKTGRAGLPLAVAFRVLFVLSGIMPILLMAALAHGLIEASYATSLIELRRESTEKLARISEKSDNLKSLFGFNISEGINDLGLHRLLTSNRREDAEKAYELLRHRLEKMELALDYLYVFVPGGISELAMQDQRIYKNAKTVMDLFGPAIYKINQRYAELWNLPEVNLDASQKNFHTILNSFHRTFLEEIFMYSYEKEIAIKFGDQSANYFFTVVFSDGGRIKSYAGFAVNSEKLFRNFLARELDSLNISETNLFVAAEELPNSEFTIFPFKKMNVLNSRIGRNAMDFITRCRTSLYEKYFSTRDHTYIYSPLNNARYACGCVVSLAGINRERNLKRLALVCISVLLICLMYVMASFAASYMLSPLGAINLTLQAISRGDLEQDLEFVRGDEIGQLAGSINQMLEGFKRRLRLGKFVSTTFEQSLAENLSLEESQKARTINGSVLFSDIRSFTTLSEENPPGSIASMLNEHLETMSALIQKFDGQVEQFIGDAIVAFFPDQQPQDSKQKAISAAFAMHQAHQAIIKARADQNKFAYDFGIGLAYGQIIAGALITPARSEFCIIGRAKADAEHLEQLSKQGRHTRIVLTPDLTDAATKCGFLCAPLAAADFYELVSGDTR